MLVSRSTFPRSATAIGHTVRALERLLARYPGDDVLVGQVVWLDPAPFDKG